MEPESYNEKADAAKDLAKARCGIADEIARCDELETYREWTDEEVLERLRLAGLQALAMWRAGVTDEDEIGDLANFLIDVTL